MFPQLLEWLFFYLEENTKRNYRQSLGSRLTWQKVNWSRYSEVLIVPGITLSSCGTFSKFFWHLAFNLSFVIFLSNSDFLYKPKTYKLYLIALFFPHVLHPTQDFPLALFPTYILNTPAFHQLLFCQLSPSHDYLSQTSNIASWMVFLLQIYSYL